ncbi:hypothetical protein WN51_09121 [Melipona quadrifasciata]|uniref:Uncharacterized protein n=2 Tax=Melipona TaxID=28651 RepID=A0A0M9AAQ4_9HYME|nr:hypothetical protein WN51_09121 [Melipona quadrifasciata]
MTGEIKVIDITNTETQSQLATINQRDLVNDDSSMRCQTIKSFRRIFVHVILSYTRTSFNSLSLSAVGRAIDQSINTTSTTATMTATRSDDMMYPPYPVTKIPVSVLNHPAYSSDLNVIEGCWAESVAHMKMFKLKKCLAEEWDNHRKNTITINNNIMSTIKFAPELSECVEKRRRNERKQVPERPNLKIDIYISFQNILRLGMTSLEYTRRARKNSCFLALRRIVLGYKSCSFFLSDEFESTFPVVGLLTLNERAKNKPVFDLNLTGQSRSCNYYLEKRLPWKDRFNSLTKLARSSRVLFVLERKKGIRNNGGEKINKKGTGEEETKKKENRIQQGNNEPSVTNMISYQRVQKKKKATNYCIRFGHSLWSANQLSAQEHFEAQMGNGVIPLMVVAMVPIIAGTIGQRALSKRNTPTNIDYPDYSAKYDEYPQLIFSPPLIPLSLMKLNLKLQLEFTEMLRWCMAKNRLGTTDLRRRNAQNWLRSKFRDSSILVLPFSSEKTQKVDIAKNDRTLPYTQYIRIWKFYIFITVVVPKRAALLFDQLMVALQKVVDNQGRGELGGGSRTFTRSSGSHLSSGNSQVIPSADEQTMDLQRRGQAKGRVYWRCYFNAVTCFKRK